MRNSQCNHGTFIIYSVSIGLLYSTSRWLPAYITDPAKAKALPHEGALCHVTSSIATASSVICDPMWIGPYEGPKSHSVLGHKHSTIKRWVVQEVVTQVGQLFLQPVASAAAPLLVQQASEDMSSGELMFSPLPGQERSQEAEAWQVKLLTLKHLHNGETRFYCPQTSLSLDFQCRDDIYELQQPFWD